MLPLYERIEKLCKDNGINITQMCKSANVQRSALSDYKSGKNKTISFPNLQKIADFFNITVDELVNGETKTSPATMTEDEELQYVLEQYKNRPCLRMLFKVSDKATAKHVYQAAEQIEALTLLEEHKAAEE